MTRRLLFAMPIYPSGLAAVAVTAHFCLAAMQRPQPGGKGPGGQPSREPAADTPGGGRRAQEDSGLVQEAVRRAQRGDREGVHFLYVRYAPGLLRYINSFVDDRHEAEDIVQNVFAKLITAIAKYERRDVPFSAWILRVTRNAALDHLRARRAFPTEEVRVADIGSTLTRFERARDLRDALDRLPSAQREVLVLRHVVGLSPMEIADTLGRTESSVHGLHHRGRRALQSSLRELGAGPTVGP